MRYCMEFAHIVKRVVQILIESPGFKAFQSRSVTTVFGHFVKVTTV